MTDFQLSGAERINLENQIEHATDARLVVRAYALLWLDDGESIEEIATRLSVTRQTVYNWQHRFQDRKGEFLPRLSDAPRSGRPKTATTQEITALIESVIERDPRELNYLQTSWTASLLVGYLWERQKIRVSIDSVRRVIAELEIRWKRPRHSLALRPLTWRQSKGG